MRGSLPLTILLILGAGCSSTSRTDAGPTESDSGPPASDAGVATDAGPLVDSGSPPAMDGGVPDSGFPQFTPEVRLTVKETGADGGTSYASVDFVYARPSGGARGAMIGQDCFVYHYGPSAVVLGNGGTVTVSGAGGMVQLTPGPDNVYASKTVTPALWDPEGTSGGETYHIFGSDAGMSPPAYGGNGIAGLQQTIQSPTSATLAAQGIDRSKDLVVRSTPTFGGRSAGLLLTLTATRADGSGDILQCNFTGLGNARTSTVPTAALAMIPAGQYVFDATDAQIFNPSVFNPGGGNYWNTVMIFGAYDRDPAGVLMHFLVTVH